MAINVNVPGIGTISVDGAASEDTLKQVLSAMRAMNRNMSRGGGGSGSGKSGGAGGGNQTTPATSGMAALIAATQGQIQQVGILNRAFNGATGILKTFGGTVAGVMKDVAKVGLAVTTAWMTSADAMAEDPIRAGAQMISTSIDLITKMITRTTDMLGKFLGGIPMVGGVIKGASEAFKAGVETAGSIFKVANEFMAAEFQKTVESFGRLNRIGATFSGSMDELNDIVTTSGIPINKFTEAVVNSRDSILAMGLNVANGTKLVAAGLNRLATTVGTSGRSMREELLLLGYSYQEQGELVAEYTAAMVMAGKSRADIDKDVEQGTAKYAKNLKIISDITGEDARKKMAEARRESMRAALMNKLSGDQRVAFQQAYNSMSQFPELQEALVQKLSIGEVINPAVAMNESFMGLINNVSRDVEQGSKDIIVRTLTGIAETAEELRSKQQDLGTAIDIAKIAGASGVVATAADIFNKVAAVTMTPQQIKEAAEAIEKNIKNTGNSANSYAAAVDATTDFANKMGDIARNQMPAYAALIARATTETTAALDQALVEARKISTMGIENYVKGGLKEITDKLTETDEEKKSRIEMQDKSNIEAASFAEKLFSSHYLSRALESSAKGMGELLSAVDEKTMAGIPKLIGGLLTRLGLKAQESRVGEETDYLRGKSNLPERAMGGTISGPDTGYPVLLHGTEAVVPLPDGRSIPVQVSQNSSFAGSIDMSRLEDLVAKQADQMKILSEMMREMVSVAQDHRNISRDIYDVSA